MSSHCPERAGHYAQRVSDSDSGTFGTVVNCEYPSQGLLSVEDPGALEVLVVRIFCLEGVTLGNGLLLGVKAGANHAVGLACLVNHYYSLIAVLDETLTQGVGIGLEGETAAYDAVCLDILVT